MPTRIEVLPEDIQAFIYRKLYSSILGDMKRSDIYKNTIYFHKLLEITDNPLVYDLDYLGMLNINAINGIYDVFKYKNISKYKNHELFQPETAIYLRSYFTKRLEITLDNIKISSVPLYNLYTSNKRYYWAFAKEYITTTQLRIHKGTFILQQAEPFSCMAELLYNVIAFYNRIKDVLCANISEEDDVGILTQRQRKDKYIMEDALGYHINNRFITRFEYDITMKSAFPILLPY
jgi:hypothetical protein